MTATPPQADAGDPLAIYEQIAVEFLAEEGEAAHRDNCEHQLDRFSDAALADQLVTAWAGRALAGDPTLTALNVALTIHAHDPCEPRANGVPDAAETEARWLDARTPAPRPVPPRFGPSAHPRSLRRDPEGREREPEAPARPRREVGRTRNREGGRGVRRVFGYHETDHCAGGRAR